MATIRGAASIRINTIYYLDFVEIALFKTSGDICGSPLPSWLLDKLFVNKEVEGETKVVFCSKISDLCL